MASNLRVDSIVPATGTNVAIGTATGGVTIPGDLGIAGVLTYEDVTNIDSVGVITARSGIRIGATGANTLITGNGTGIGIGITTPTEELHIRAATPVIRLEDGDNAKQSQIVGSDGNLRLDADNNNAIADTNIAFRTDGGERLRIGPVGQIGIGGANYGTSGQVLTSQGSGSAVQWATPSSITTAGGTMTLGFRDHVSNAVSSTTPTAYYQRIGNMVFCSCDTGAINLSGLNNGEILLVTGCFPITRDNNWTMAGSAYQYTVTSNTNGGGATIVPTMGYWLSNTSLYFVIPRVSSTSDNLTVGMCNSNNTRIFMQWHYKVN